MLLLLGNEYDKNVCDVNYSLTLRQNCSILISLVNSIVFHFWVEILTFFKIITRMLMSYFLELWMQTLRKQSCSFVFVWNISQIMNLPQGFIVNFFQETTVTVILHDFFRFQIFNLQGREMLFEIEEPRC